MKTSVLRMFGMIAFAIGIVFYPNITSAIEVIEPSSQDVVVISTDDRIEDDVLIVGDRVDIDGVIMGDAYVMAGTVIVRGTIEGSLYIFSGSVDVLPTGAVTGDVFAAAGQTSIEGTVGDDVLIASGSTTLNGSVADNVSVASGDITTRSDFAAGRDVSFGVGQASLEGTIGRWLNLAAGQVDVKGSIAQGIRGQVDALTLSENAVVNGAVSVHGSSEPSIHERATIAGDVEWSETAKDLPSNSSVVGVGALGTIFAGSAAGVAKLTSNFIFGFLGSVLLGALLIWLWPNGLRSVVSRVHWFPRKSILIGGISIIIAPFVIVGLLVTLVGAPFSLLLGTVLLALGTLSTPVVGLWFGRWILKRRKKPVHDVWAMSLGVLILSLVIAIPLVGTLVKVIMISQGIGAGLLALRGSEPDQE